MTAATRALFAFCACFSASAALAASLDLSAVRLAIDERTTSEPGFCRWHAMALDRSAGICHRGRRTNLSAAVDRCSRRPLDRQICQPCRGRVPRDMRPGFCPVPPRKTSTARRGDCACNCSVWQRRPAAESPARSTPAWPVGASPPSWLPNRTSAHKLSRPVASSPSPRKRSPRTASSRRRSA